MSEIDIRIEGCAGRITLNRPKALNAVTYEMVLAIEAALDAWRDNPSVGLVIIDGVGEKAFSAGGDLAKMYETGSAGDYSYGRQFWRDEYRLNAKIASYPKPYVAFMQGFTMGGGVGVSCHGSHRIVCESSKIAMPECAVGLVPDVGGTYLLAGAPGRLGEYLGMTGARMGPHDAVYAGFADYFVPEADWENLKALLVESGDVGHITGVDGDSELKANQALVDAGFAGDTHLDIVETLAPLESEWADKARRGLASGSPISVACTVELLKRAKADRTIENALTQEYRFTHRSVEHGDFVEGIRAMIVEKDRAPKWKHESLAMVAVDEVAQMLTDLGEEELDLG